MAEKTLMVMIFALAALFFTPSTIAGSNDTPFIVVHKDVSIKSLQSGADRLSVSIDIYNRGSVTAYDVSLTDDSWAQDIFNSISGKTSKSWERLEGGSSVSHSFELESQVKGIFYGSPAVVTFRIPTKAALQEAYSTPILPLDILADRPSEKKLELAKRLVAEYGPVISVISSVSLFIYLIATPPKSSASKGSKKRR